MIHQDIFVDLQKSFSALWNFKERENSLEIITPYVTSSQKFVSVFLTQRNGDYIVSDGGWVDTGYYENHFSLDDDSFAKLFFYYSSSFDIKETSGLNRRRYFYKKTENAIAIPSLVFDLANFISFIISSSEVEFSSIEEKETKERFKKLANDYIHSLVPRLPIRFNAHLGQRRDIRFNAIINKTSSKLILVNYITGSTELYFTSSIARANLYFEMASASEMKDHIQNRISLIDTDAKGFQQGRSGGQLKFLSENTSAETVTWMERERLEGLL